VKLLLVTLYFPPTGGGGVQRPLKFAQYLPALGIETHVLAPDDSKWIHSDSELRVPTQAWVHRARFIGPKGRKPAEELHGKEGVSRALVYARLASRRLLVPDENVSWNLTSIPAALRIAREHGIDAVLTTSPPGSVHLVGAAVQKATGAKWVADLRDSLAAHPHRRSDSPAARAKQKAHEGVARLVGYGHANPAGALVSDEHRVTALGAGGIADGDAHVFRLPLPPSLAAKTARRRLTLTLAWLTPINPEHRGYRRAALALEPTGGPKLVAERSDVTTRPSRRGTVQHERLEGRAAVPFASGSALELTVACRADAGALESSVPYALIATLEVPHELGLPIYEEVRQALRVPVGVRTGT